MKTPGRGPHSGQPLMQIGAPIDSARAALILLHGRGARAADIMSLHALLERDYLVALAPQAAGFSWYPDSFMASWEANAEGRDSGVSVVEGLVEGLESAGLPARRILISGFSQGACLACDFLLRHPRRYGALAAFTGGLGGPPGSTWRAWLDGRHPLAGMPVYLGAGDPDPHVPWRRVAETAEVFDRMGAEVRAERLTGQGHVIGSSSLEVFRDLVSQVADRRKT